MSEQSIADELREWNRTYPSDGNPQMVDKAIAEIERLRCALEYIANAEGDVDGNIDGSDLVQIAIEALKGAANP